MRRLLLIVLTLAACSSDEPRKVKTPEFEVSDAYQALLMGRWSEVPADQKAAICADETDQLGIVALLEDAIEGAKTDPETLFNTRYFLDNTACD